MEDEKKHFEKKIEPMPSELEEKIEIEEDNGKVLYVGQIKGIHNHGADIMASYVLTKYELADKPKKNPKEKGKMKRAFAKLFSGDTPKIFQESEWSYSSDPEDHSMVLHSSSTHPPILYNSEDDVMNGFSGRGGLYQNAAQNGTLLGVDLIENVFGKMEKKILDIYKQRIE